MKTALIITWIIGGIVAVILAAKKTGKVYEERISKNLPPPEGGAIIYPIVFLGSWMSALILILGNER